MRQHWGQTWTNIGVPPFNTELIHSMVFTASGKLLVTNALIPLLISPDKGKTWTSVPFTAFVPQNMVQPSFNDPSEDSNGNLYVVEQQDQVIFKSTDSGKTWAILPPTGSISPGTEFSFYIDNNNWFYKGVTRLNQGIFISKDKGVTYNKILTTILTAEPDKMSVQTDGNFYFEDIAAGLYTYNGGTSGTLLFSFGATNPQAYIVAKNNNIIVANVGKPYLKYYTK